MELYEMDQYIPFYCEDISKIVTQTSPPWHQYRNNLVVYKLDRRRSINLIDFIKLTCYRVINLYDGQRVYLMQQIVSHYVQNYFMKNIQLIHPFQQSQIWIMLENDSKVFGPGFDLHYYKIVFIKDIRKNNENGLNQYNQDESLNYFLQFFKEIVVMLNKVPHTILDEQKINKTNSIIELLELLKKEIDDKYNPKEQKFNKGWFQFEGADIRDDWMNRFNQLKNAVPQLTIRYNREYSLSLSYLRVQNQILKMQLDNLKLVGVFVFQSHNKFSDKIVKSQSQQIQEAQNKLLTLNEESETQVNPKVEQIFKVFYKLVIEKIEEQFSKEFKMTEPNKYLIDKNNEQRYLENFNAEILSFYLKGDNQDPIHFINNIQEGIWKLMFQSTLEMMKEDHKYHSAILFKQLVGQLQ